MKVESLSPDCAAEITSVFCDAFYDYSVMRHVVGEVGDLYDRRLNLLIGFFVAARVLRGDPILGIRNEDGRLIAAATLTPPNSPDAPPELSTRREIVWTELGDGARSRYENLGNVWQDFGVATPDLHLNMIGVCGDHAGSGLGRTLLEAVHQIAEADNMVTGVTLTTEMAANVSLYEKFGYLVIGHKEVTGDLETWGFFRPNPGDE
jgi:GNAT superfamily N-acetyltransferase